MSVSAHTIERDIATGLTPRRAGAVSWPAIFAGAAAAAALSLILLVLGAGLGLASVSPWVSHGASTAAITWSTIAWITFMALASSGLGGYIAGRLRVRWPDIHMDEAYFRDTAHGFLAWAVATLVTVAVLSSVIGTLVGAGAAAGATVAAAGGTKALVEAAPAAGQSQTSGKDSVPLYTVDALFRVPATTAAATSPAGQRVTVPVQNPAQGSGDSAAMKAETGRILANSLHAGPLSEEDTRYAGQLIAQRTGLSQQEAEARVTSAYTALQKNLQEAQAKAKELADEARKNAAYASLWIFVSLLVGAFASSLMATWGGRQRDLT